MATYSDEQIRGYLSYIGCDASHLGATPSLANLSQLVSRQEAAVPFESLSLHYSKTHALSLKPHDLYAKIVGTGRGGYCMENNAFFGVILRSLGYRLFHAGARVSNATGGIEDGGFMGLNHMVNLVDVDGQRYLVDVGFGGNGPCRPLPLISGYETAGMPPQALGLDRRTLPQHTDEKQQVWVYSHRENDEKPWVDGYCFTEMEFFAADFEVMNLATMTLRQSFFVQNVIAVKVLLDEQDEPQGQVILFGGTVSRRLRGVTEVVETLDSEDQRIKTLTTHFGIVLSEEQKQGIRGLASELHSSRGTTPVS